MEPNHPPPAVLQQTSGGASQFVLWRNDDNDTTDSALAALAAAGAAAVADNPYSSTACNLSRAGDTATISAPPDSNLPLSASLFTIQHAAMLDVMWKAEKRARVGVIPNLPMGMAASRFKAVPFYSRSIAELWKGKQPSQRAHVVPEFLEQCKSPAFDDFVREAGLEYLNFEPNHSATAANAIYDRFVEACKHLPDIATLAIAFHGTNEDNIPIILKEGLDPEKRTGQAYGPGEYFSTDPGTSTSYCRRTQHTSNGGGKMLVFLVVKPIQQAPKCPIDYIVVPTNEHELPLGVLSYGKVEAGVLSLAAAMRTKLQRLHQELQDREHRAFIARIKAKVIQKVITDELDVASESYQKNCQVLDLAAKKEISTYAHTKYDGDFVCFYFPDLPARMTAEEEQQMISVEALEGEVRAKKNELLTAENSSII